MITVNLTLLIQAVHFLIAYFLISKFLLKPALAALKADINKRALLRNKVIEEQEKLLNKKEQKTEAWHKYQDYFYKHKPKDLTNMVISEIDTLSVSAIKKLSKPELESIAYDITTILKSKVING